MSKEWDKANMKTLGVNLKKEDAEAFRAYAAANGTTVGAILRVFIQGLLETAAATETSRPNEILGVAHVVSYKNTDRLKHETSFHNPKNLNPNGILNEILDDYFRFVEKVRR